jgi:isoquinoline 1-oxidoreductase beta subunit
MTEQSTHTKSEITNVSRRGLLKGLAATGGLILAIQLPGVRQVLAAGYPTGASEMPNGVVSDPKLFVAIAPDGTVTIVAARAEMGTGAARTTLPMMIADELDADWTRVKIVQAPGDEKVYGNQDTDGSRSTRHFIQPMRQCGASARMMLEEAAAKKWGVDVADVEAKFHEVVNKKTGAKLGYGEIAADAAKLPVPAADKVKLKPQSAFRYMGKGNIRFTDLNNITTGAAVYGQDVVLPGMKFAVIARPPVVGGKVASVDSSAAEKVPGVEKVFQIPGTGMPGKFMPLGGVVVVAKNTWAAIKGREALKITWDDGPNKAHNSADYRATLEAAVKKPGKMERSEGDADAALASAAKVVSADYYSPHLAHATMEPPAATARMENGKWEVWAPLQSPGGAKDDIAAALGIDRSMVTVHETLLGGGFGRKSKCDYAIEAAFVSKALNGAPVKVVWTREDDIRHGYYHTVTAERLEAGLDKDNKVVAWRHRSASPTFFALFAPDQVSPSFIELGLGLVDAPFNVPNIRVESGEAQAHVRIGWFRSVNNVAHAWAIQSFIGELAHELKRDPKDLLIELIGPDRIVDPRKTVSTPFWDYGEPFEVYPIDTARLKKVTQLAAEKAGWGKTLPKGEGIGIAAHRSFVTYVATVVHVKVDDKGTLTIPRVDTAIDCGFCVNPERVRSQIEGAAVMGLTLAKYGAITLKDGAVEQSNLHDFQLARIDDAPLEVHTHIVDHPVEVPAAGVGEPGVPPFTPALCNAIFAATGKRIRQLPIGEKLV